MASQPTGREQTEQERLIAQKKQELLQRIQAKKKGNASGSSSTSTVSSSSASASNQQTSGASAKPAMFMNDGNFLERFKQMQQQQQTRQPGQPEQASSSGQYRNTVSLKLSSVKKPTPSLPKPVSSKVAEVFEKEDHHVSPIEGKAEAIDVLDKVAAIVAAGGEMVEKLLKSKNEGNPQYSFLFNEGSAEHKHYRGRVEMYKHRAAANQASLAASSSTAAASVAPAQPSTVSFPSSSYVPSSQPQTEQAPSAPTQGRRKRRSRWGEGADSALSAAAAAVAAVEQQAFMTTQEQMEREKQRREQEEIQAMYMSIVAKKRAAEIQAQSNNKPKYEYDSDEETEGGTWEHKKRKKEMQKTLDDASKLTEMNKGKHFIGDFLPKEELDKFLKKVRAIKGGEDIDLSDYSEHKIKEDNVGYKLLQKAGWKEGQGLGAEGKGITAPINKGKTSLDSSGLGTEKPHEIQQQDDEFDTFRKRMMLAYRFRPNPLNNPRRPYY